MCLRRLPPVFFSVSRGFAARGRAYLRHLFMANEILGAVLNTTHNLHFYLELMRRIREAIAAGTLAALRNELHAALAAASD